jgi:aspartyl protease
VLTTLKQLEIRIGTSPRQYRLDVDTGSTVSWIRSKTHLNTSSTAKRLFKNTENEVITFHDGTAIQVTYITDVVHFLQDGLQVPAAEVILGITQTQSLGQSDHDGTHSDGIIGLGCAPHVPGFDGEYTIPNLIAAFHAQGLLRDSTFSIVREGQRDEEGTGVRLDKFLWLLIVLTLLQGNWF